MSWKWMRRLLPSPTPRLEDHISIWSVRKGDAGTFFLIVAALWLVALAHMGYKSMQQAGAPLAGWDGVVAFVLAVLIEFVDVCVPAAAVAMLLTRPVNMIGGAAMTLYQAMVNRWVFPVIERHRAEGRAQGIAQGRTEGRTQGLTEGRTQGRTEGLEQGRSQAHEEWMAWNRRRVEAERHGRDFDESPPCV